MAGFAFNAAAVEPAKGPEIIPAGKYTAVAIESEIAPTKTAGGQQIKLTFQVIEGLFKGRKVFARINVRNSNAQAEQIGQAELSALCHATGVLNLQDTVQLHNRPVQIRVAVRKDSTGQYEDQNEVKGYAAAPAGLPGGPAAFPPAQQSFPAGAPAPWQAPAAQPAQPAAQAWSAPAQPAAQPTQAVQVAPAQAAPAQPAQPAPAAPVAAPANLPPWQRQA